MTEAGGEQSSDDLSMVDVDEVEILRGPKVSITNRVARSDGRVAPVEDILDFALIEAEPKIRLAPLGFYIAGPLLGIFLWQEVGWVARALGAAMLVMAVGAFLQREASQHQVSVRLKDRTSFTLYRTAKLNDARLFHAAVAKAVEMREAEASSRQ